MTRFLTYFVFSLATIIIGAVQKPHFTKDKSLLFKQEFVYQIFWNPQDLHVYHSEIVNKANSFKVEDLRNLPVNKNFSNDFIARWHHGLLPRGRSASAFLPEHMAEIVSFFNVVYDAEDFDTFALIATWSRNVLNEMLWFFSIATAVLQRPDTRHVRLPRLYELLPQFCYNSDVVFQYQAKKHDDSCWRNVIKANYSKTVAKLENDYESRVVYFTEDVGLNNYYFLMALDLPFWMSSKEYDLPSYRRGERYFNNHKQILARYELERLSNRLVKTEDIDFAHNIFTGYYPSMVDFNGVAFPWRPHNSPIPVYKYKEAQLAREYEQRIVDAADNRRIQVKGKQSTSDTDDDEYFSDFMNLIQGNADSLNPNFYGSFDSIARYILGFERKPYNKFNVEISALENLNADVRDPAFYRIYKKITDFGYRYKQLLPPYTEKEIGFSGVRIDDVRVGEIVTYFDQFESVFGYKNCKHSFNKKRIPTLVHQSRLNHNDFDVHIKINSQISGKGIVRIFIGPLINVHGLWVDIDEVQHDFYQLDQFVVDLKKGPNTISRSDRDFSFQAPIEPRSDIFYEAVRKAIDEDGSLAYYKKPYGFPRRLMIPRGRAEGLPLRLLVIVNEFKPDQRGIKTDTLIAGDELDDGRALGFPLDRPVEAYKFKAPNMVFKEIRVYHKGELDDYVERYP